MGRGDEDPRVRAAAARTLAGIQVDDEEEHPAAQHVDVRRPNTPAALGAKYVFVKPSDAAHSRF